MKEEWVEIPGYREIYMVSNLGSVKTKTRPGARGYIVEGHPLVTRDNSNGYPRVSIRMPDDAKSKDYLVHRLVAKAFIPEINDKVYVNHIDGDKHNNSVDNLEWCTRSENEKHSIATGLRKPTCLKGEKHGGRRFDQLTVDKIREEYIKGDPEHGQCALARKYGTSQAHIHEIVTRKIWTD